jgi:hypothetical protein
MIGQLTNSGFMGIALGLLAYGREATDMEAFSRPFTEAVEALRFDEAAGIGRVAVFSSGRRRHQHDWMADDRFGQCPGRRSFAESSSDGWCFAVS